jgi:ornithine--oxo-acid transaminase
VRVDLHDYSPEICIIISVDADFRVRHAHAGESVMSTQTINAAQVIPSLVSSRPNYLMCRPEFYNIDYVINPWMAGNLHATSMVRAAAEWNRLHDALSEIANIMLVDPQPRLPDMVFTANAGLAHNGTVVLSSFYHPERQAEEQHFEDWFQSSGYTIIRLSRDVPFEGEGDALFSTDGSRLWAGYGMRSTKESHSCLAQAWDVEVVSLRLIDPRFYHLDTCFAPLMDGYVMYFPGAFGAASLARIEAFYPSHKRIVVSEMDASRFACNAINIDCTVLLNEISSELTKRLESIGFNVVPIALDEFLKAGGAAKCLVMKLSPPAAHTVDELTA